jgi:TfoX/Sxy family transcriptional regulator of competence genes
MRNEKELTPEMVMFFIFFTIGYILLSLFWYSIFLGILLFIGTTIFLLGIHWYIKYSVDRYIDGMDVLISELNDIIYIDDSTINEILNHSEALERIFQKAQILKYLSFFWKKEKMRNMFEGYAYYIENTVLTLLVSLRNQLILRMNEQADILISSKSDVAKNLKGTPELVKVSELQQARLDSQIAEFEKLQKIIVKV